MGSIDDDSSSLDDSSREHEEPGIDRNGTAE
jgi:hypothetical protein